jgi:beta-galactosidase
VELRLNGRRIGRERTGRHRGNVARFTVPWASGELVAIAYRAGVETGRSMLRSATGELRLNARPDRHSLISDGQDAAFLEIEIADADGIVEQLADDEVEVRIEGPATLAGFGSAAPATEESFTDARHTTYRGRALAVIRSNGNAGEARVLARSPRFGKAQVDLSFAPAGA